MNWIVHIILLILGEIWSKGSNLTSLLLIDVYAEVTQVNIKALNIKSYQPWQKHCQASAEAKCIFISFPRHFICRGKKCWNSRAVAKVDFWVLTSFRACKTMERCSQQQGAFSIQPIYIESLMNLLLHIKWVSKCLEVRLKKSLPSTFKRAIGQKSESLVSDQGLTLQIYISWALCHWRGFCTFWTCLKIFENEFVFCHTFFVNLVMYTI